MMRDDCISGSLALKKLLILSIPWDIIPASEESNDMDIAEDVKNQFNNFGFEVKGVQYYNIPFNHILNNFLDSMRYGFRVAEKMWMLVDGKWRLINLKFMHPLYFDFGYDEYNDLNELVIGRNYGQETNIEGIDNIFNKFMILVNPYLKDGNFYGESDLMEVYMQYRAKKNIFNFRNIHLERWGSPLPEAIYEKGKVESNELDNLVKTFKHLQQRYYIIQPGQRNSDGELKGKFQINLHEAKNARATDQYEQAIQQIDTQIKRKLLIPDKLGFTDSDGGSYALGKNHLDIFLMTMKFYHNELENLINPLIRQMVDYNYSVEDYPRFEFSEIKGELEANILKTLLDYEVIDPKEKWIRGRYSIPELTEKEKEEIEKENEEKPEPDMPEDIPEEPEDIPEKELKFARGKNPFDAKKIKRTLNGMEADFLKDYSKIYKFNLSKLLGQVEKKKIIEDKDYKAIKTLRINKTNLRNLFEDYYGKLYFTGKAQAIEEVEGRLPKTELQFDEVKLQEEDWTNRKWVDNYLADYGTLGTLTAADKTFLKTVRDRAFYITGIEEDDILKKTYHIIDNGIREGLPTSTVIEQIKAQNLERLDQYGLTIARTNAAEMYNVGRMNMFTKSPLSQLIEAYHYQAIIDDRTTLFCESHDGQIIKASDPEFIYIQPPNHFNCRSMLVAVMAGEKEQKGNYFYEYDKKFDTWGTKVPNDARKPAEGFGS